MVSDLSTPAAPETDREEAFDGTNIVLNARREGSKVKIRVVLGTSRNLDPFELKAITLMATILDAGCEITRIARDRDNEMLDEFFPFEKFADECNNLLRRSFAAFAEAAEGKGADNG